MNRKVSTALSVVLGLLLGLGGGILLSQDYGTYDPYWAPLGGHLTTMTSGSGIVVFTSNRSGSPEVWCVRADGAFPTQLTFTDDGMWKTDPHVSIDGRWVAYTSDHNNDGCLDLFVMGIDGSHLTQLTDAATDGQSFVYAAWHPSCRAIALEDLHSRRLFLLEVNDPPYASPGELRPVEPSAPSPSDADGQYIDVLGSVASGGMIVLDSKRPDFWEATALRVDERTNDWIYVRGDACYQCGIENSCGLANFPLTIAVSSNPSAHFQIHQSPQYLDPSFFGDSWTGETGHLQFALGDTYRDDNCGSYTVWVIPHPRWDSP